MKVLPHDRTRDAHALARFEREMEAVGQLDHPNIVRAFDARELAGTHFLVMEHVEGMDQGISWQEGGKRLAILGEEGICFWDGEQFHAEPTAKWELVAGC